jgi:hypothetical protein
MELARSDERPGYDVKLLTSNKTYLRRYMGFSLVIQNRISSSSSPSTLTIPQGNEGNNSNGCVRTFLSHRIAEEAGNCIGGRC